jgi:hypothetical protein
VDWCIGPFCGLDSALVASHAFTFFSLLTLQHYRFPYILYQTSLVHLCAVFLVADFLSEQASAIVFFLSSSQTSRDLVSYHANNMLR